MTARRRLVLPLAVTAAVILHAVAGRDWLRGAPHPVPAPRPDALRIVSWNLRNFPGGHDLDRARQHLDSLDPQVLATQEILEPAALSSLRPGWRWYVSDRGGRHGPQRLAIGWDPNAVDVVDAREHPSLSFDDRVRPAISGRLRPRRGGPEFTLVVVHLKATRAGFALRRQQWDRLALLLEHPAAATATATTRPLLENVLVVGDFNAAGGPNTEPSAERHALADRIGPIGFSPWTIVGGCTAYWDGSRRDRWWEPSQLDLVWGRGFAALSPPERRAHAGTHCARHGCLPFSASEHHPDPDMQGISDHCPVVIDIPVRGPDRR